MSDSIYTTYDSDVFSYYTPSSFDNRTRDYLLYRYTPKAVWDYGDTPAILFTLHECGLSTEEILSIQGKYIRIKFYTNRFELIPFDNEIEATEEFNVTINYETSLKYFKRGTYYCSIELIEYNENDESTVRNVQTILPMFRCCFYVQ